MKKLANAKALLFSGTPQPFGGLSNEWELVQKIPEEFNDINNPWVRCASRIFFSGANMANWKWKTGDRETRRRQLACFKGLISGFGLKHEDKEAAAGWMLSEMLAEVPEEKKP